MAVPIPEREEKTPVIPKEVRVEKFVKLIFTKVKNAKKLGVARACQGCGANLDLNFDGRCPYCGAIFNLQEYDWILEDIL